MANDGTVKIGTELDESGLSKGLSGVGNKLGSLASTGFKAMTAAVTATATAVAGLGAAAYKAGAEFETSMTKASTLFGDVAVETENLNQKILEISSKTGVAAAEMGEALYSALSAGIPVSEDMAEATMVLEKSAQLAKAGFTDVDTALAATAKTMNAYGLGVEAVDDIQKILIQTQNLGITTVDELGASLAQVTPTAAAFGVSFDQVGAALAEMTAAGTPTAQATTQLNSLIAELGKNGTVAAKNLEAAAAGTQYAGMGFKEMMDSGATLQDVLSMLSKEAEKSGVSLVDMFSSIEAGKAALSIDAGDFEGSLAAMSTEADVVSEAFEKMNNTMESQVGRMKTSLTNLGISMYQSVGSPMAEVSGMAADMIEDLQSAFNEGGFAGLAEAGGTVVAELATNISKAAPTLIETAVTILGSLLSGLQQNLPVIVEGAMQTIASFCQGIASMLPTIVQMGLSIVMQMAQALLSNMPLIIQTGVQLLSDLILGISSMLPDLIQMAVDLVIEFATTLVANLPTIVEAGLELLVSLIEGILDALPQLLDQAPVIIGQLVESLIKCTPKLLEAALRIMIAIGKYMVQSISSLISYVPRVIESIKNAFTNTDWGEIGRNIIDGIKNGVVNKAKDLASAVVDAAKAAVSGVKEFLGIHSPSRLMRDLIGKNMIAGVSVGVREEAPNLVRTSQKEMESVVDGIQATVGTIGVDRSAAVNHSSEPDRPGGSGDTINNYNFYQPVESPDETARAIRKANTFGLAGA